MGFSGAFVLADVETNRPKVYGTNDKALLHVAVRQWKTYMAAQGLCPRVLYTDAGTVEKSASFQEHMAAMGITVICRPDHISEYQPGS